MTPSPPIPKLRSHSLELWVEVRDGSVLWRSSIRIKSFPRPWYLEKGVVECTRVVVILRWDFDKFMCHAHIGVVRDVINKKKR